MNERQKEVTQQEYERIKALLGADADMFKRSKLGQYILGITHNAIEVATNQLKKVDPRDHEGIQDLQNQIWKNESFEIFLDDAIHSGNLAMQNLRIMEDHEDENNFTEPPPDEDGDYISPPSLPGE